MGERAIERVTDALPGLIQGFRRGLRWLATEQPDGAALSHHAPGHLGRWGDVSASMLHTGAGGKPVLVVDVRLEEQADGQFVGHLTDAECHAVYEAVLGEVEIVDTWNGAGANTMSLAFDRERHPSIDRAHQVYRAGCPEHGGPFCNGWQNSQGNRGCTYMRDRMRLAVGLAGCGS